MVWNAKFSWALAGALLVAGALPAQQSESQAPAEEPKDEIEDVIVVTASRTEQAINEAPSAITVLDSRTIESIPADDYGDLLRNVPGLNVSQTSARDVNMTSRGSTNTLSTSQLVLLDGRSIYLDFFGFVMWDFLPVNPGEIKQIEAVRGPGSAVWGANAMTGVVNLITKRPKEMVGTSLFLGGGELGTAYGSLSHAGVSGKVGYKFSGGYYEQDAYDRPTGVIPGSNPPQSYPPFENQGTAQPKGDLRIDWDVDEGQYFSFGGGYAGTDGIIHTGIGPFDIDKSSNLSYGKATYTHHALSRRPVRELPGRRLDQPAHPRRRRQSAPLRLLDRHLQPRRRQHDGGRRAQHPHLRRQLPVEHASTSRSHPTPRTRRSGASSCRTRSCSARRCAG